MMGKGDMVNRFLVFLMLFFAALPTYSDEFVLGNALLNLTLPKGFSQEPAAEQVLAFSKKVGQVEIAITITFKGFQTILDQTPMERSPYLYNLLLQKGAITKADVLRLMNMHESPVLFMRNPYSVYSCIERFAIATGELGEKVSILGLDGLGDYDGISGPFGFVYYANIDRGVLRVSVTVFDRDKSAFDAAMRPYGEIVNGYLKYTDQKQVDRIFSDVYSGKLSGLPSVLEAYSVYRTLLSSLMIKQLK